MFSEKYTFMAGIIIQYQLVSLDHINPSDDPISAGLSMPLQLITAICAGWQPYENVYLFLRKVQNKISKKKKIKSHTYRLMTM